MTTARGAGCAGGLLLAAGLLAGCAATVKELRRHPEQARLERLLGEVLPHTEYPNKHYWVRVADPSKDRIGLAVLPQRHIYLAEALVAAADEALLRALITHAVAHHRLHHYNQRGAANLLQRAAFKAGGVFVPGLSQAHYVGGPVSEQLLGPRHESSADERTLVYLRRMGRPEEDFARALEFLASQGLAERIGRTASRGETLERRAARVRKRGNSRIRLDPAIGPPPLVRLRVAPRNRGAISGVQSRKCFAFHGTTPNEAAGMDSTGKKFLRAPAQD